MSNMRTKALGVLFLVVVSMTSWVLLVVILLYGMRTFVKALMAVLEIGQSA